MARKQKTKSRRRAVRHQRRKSGRGLARRAKTGHSGSGARSRPKTRAKAPRKLARQRPSAQKRIPAKVRSRPPRPRKPGASPLAETAVLEMNRGSSLTAAARSSHLTPKQLQGYLIQQRLAKRKGRRWITKDNRSRRVPVMTGGRFRVLTVRGYEQARRVGEHHHAVGEFVRTNDIALVKPFEGQSVEAINGRRYELETRPNSLHRIAAMDSPPFHEIYEITSNT